MATAQGTDGWLEAPQGLAGRLWVGAGGQVGGLVGEGLQADAANGAGREVDGAGRGGLEGPQGFGRGGVRRLRRPAGAAVVRRPRG